MRLPSPAVPAPGAGVGECQIQAWFGSVKWPQAQGCVASALDHPYPTTPHGLLCAVYERMRLRGATVLSMSSLQRLVGSAVVAGLLALPLGSPAQPTAFFFPAAAAT